MADEPRRETTPEPAAAVFATTHWSVVLDAARGESPQAADALAQLCRTYWLPLFTYVRRSGYELHDAQDLTQAFFGRLLEKNYVGGADREKGRFRSFLLASLKHFLLNEWDRARTAKRGGDLTFISWDDPEMTRCVQTPLAPEVPADQAYDRQWTLTLLDQVFGRLREDCAAAGKVELFDALKVFLSGETVPESYAEIGARLNMSAGAVQVAVHRLRRRYGELLRAEIAHTVSRPEEIDEEIRHLFAALQAT
jgi:RNA polymerase sigma-70 factor (ECF subfamily)